MAVTQNTLIGRTKQSVGGVTFTTWKGLNVIKSKAISVANPRTPAQLLQRQRLSIMVEIYRNIAQPVQIGFNPEAVGKSEYNAFISENLINATAGTSAEDVAFVPENAVMSKGTIGKTNIIELTHSAGSPNVTFTWEPLIIPLGGSPSDIAYAVVYNSSTGKWGYSDGEEEREDGTLTCSLGTTASSSDIIYGYLFFKSQNSNDVSDSEVDNVVV